MLVARVGEEIVDPNSQPKYYQAYNLLGAGDLVISIEHCYNCEHHCATLRHDALEYVRKADHMLRTLAQIAHGNVLSSTLSPPLINISTYSRSPTHMHLSYAPVIYTLHDRLRYMCPCWCHPCTFSYIDEKQVNRRWITYR